MEMYCETCKRETEHRRDPAPGQYWEDNTEIQHEVWRCACGDFIEMHIAIREIDEYGQSHYFK